MFAGGSPSGSFLRGSSMSSSESSTFISEGKKETRKVTEETYHTIKFVHVIIAIVFIFRDDIIRECLTSELVDGPSNELETRIEGEMSRKSKTRIGETHLFLPRRFEISNFTPGSSSSSTSISSPRETENEKIVPLVVPLYQSRAVCIWQI
jgi:hypothetical protein